MPVPHEEKAFETAIERMFAWWMRPVNCDAGLAPPP